MKPIYLDYAASTPVDPKVFRAMEPYFTARFGNPGSVHASGQEAIAAIDGARESIAKAIGADFRQIVFTASATEANNLAIHGALAGAHKGTLADGRIRCIVSAIEHESVLETVREAERMGVEVIYIPVGADGVVDEKKIKENLNERTALVSIMYANNEIGSVQPLHRIAEEIKKIRGKGAFPIFHTDAVQALQFLDCNVHSLGVDMMTLSSHKIYGPKGAGLLFVRDATILTPIVHGGGQEFGLRSGTENVPAIVGLAKAVELTVALRETESGRLAELKQILLAGIKEIMPDVEVNGTGKKTTSDTSLPNILNIYFPGHAAQDLLTKLDRKGVAASSGSACRSRALEASYVIEALGYSKERAKASIRFSLGRPTTEAEIRESLKILKTCF